MKKMIPVAAVAVFALMFTSCKKDYKCNCTITVTSSGVVSSESLPIQKSTKKDAKSACNAAEATWTVAGATTASCSLN